MINQNHQKTALSLGRPAESRAAEHLISRGLSLIQKNYQGRFGEIDLIFRDQLVIVFVEVKYRKNQQF